MWAGICLSIITIDNDKYGHHDIVALFIIITITITITTTTTTIYHRSVICGQPFCDS